MADTSKEQTPPFTSLFGPSLYDFVQGQDQFNKAIDLKQAQLPPEQQAMFNSLQSGRLAGQGVQGLLGLQDPRMQRLALVKQAEQETMQSGIDPVKNPEDWYKFASHALRKRGLYSEAEEAASIARMGRSQMAKITHDEALGEQARTQADANTAAAEASRGKERREEADQPFQSLKLMGDALKALAAGDKEDTEAGILKRHGEAAKIAEIAKTRAEKEAAEARAQADKNKKIEGLVYEHYLKKYKGEATTPEEDKTIKDLINQWRPFSLEQVIANRVAETGPGPLSQPRQPGGIAPPQPTKQPIPTEEWAVGPDGKPRRVK